jgi:hypothetical protein
VGALAAPVVWLIRAFHWTAWLLRCRYFGAVGPYMMSAAHDGGTAEILEGQFPILAPGGAAGQVDYVESIDLPGESGYYGTLLPGRPGSRLLYFAKPASIKSPPAARYNTSFATGPLPPNSSRAETKNAIEPKSTP